MKEEEISIKDRIEERKNKILDKQMDMAMDGSVEMLKWLGIQYCGQSNQPQQDKSELPSGFEISLIETKKTD